MNLRQFSICCIVALAGCNTKKKVQTLNPSSPLTVTDTGSAVSFFPVTAFLKGEIFSVRNKGITPVKKTNVGQHTDSSFVKTDSLEAVFSAFLNPVIDTGNLKGIFTEKKFLDQTLNAFTYTYDPVNNKAEGFSFTHWDVYVNPDNGKVSRIYLVKNIGPAREMLLTWQTGKWCKTVWLKTVNGKTSIEKEEKISWSYE